MTCDNTYPAIPLGGFMKQSLIDYPGHIATVLFTRGCNFRCYYCHNPELVIPELICKSSSLDAENIIDWISVNSELLDAVVVTGGEPTLHSALPEFIKMYKDMGLKVKLDTNGTRPEMLERLIGNRLVDYVAMDIKAPLMCKSYEQIVRTVISARHLEKIKTSVTILNSSSIEYEYRTTYDDTFSQSDFETISSALVGRLYLQRVHVTDSKKNTEPNNLSKILPAIRQKSNPQLEILMR
jgi:pyruvate formate lyase activating enzyme